MGNACEPFNGQETQKWMQHSLHPSNHWKPEETHSPSVALQLPRTKGCNHLKSEDMCERQEKNGTAMSPNRYLPFSNCQARSLNLFLFWITNISRFFHHPFILATSWSTGSWKKGLTDGCAMINEDPVK